MFKIVESQGKQSEPKLQILLSKVTRRLPEGYQKMRDTAYISVSKQNNE